ncbi:hypothetical protein BKA69DRAFT_838647 [Paraphysoderma sedebokerense]|nr:hypothetical protein BKA69DRAFT_838647 [Paraphysoderma sedebokerense]
MTATNGTLTPLDLNFPLPLSPSSPSAALSTLNINHTPTSANHSKRNNLTIHSSQLSKNFEKEHLLSNSIKSAILEYGRSIKEAEYKGERSNGNLKVLGRSDVVMVTRDGMSVSAEKSKRLEESLKRGFASDYKEPYKPLGHPILDSNELILQSFNIAHSEQTPDTQNSLISDSQHTSVKSVKGIRSGGNKFPKMDYSGNSRSNSTVVLSDPTPPNKAETTPEKEINRNLNPDDGFELIRSRLNLSKMKLHAVKYGASFWEVDERTEKEKGKTEVPNPPKKSAERNEMKNDGAKWNNTRGIDLTMCAKEVEISKGTKSETLRAIQNMRLPMLNRVRCLQCPRAEFLTI